ncbi:type IV pilin-like G/H family protein [Nostoc sp. LEGE 06077]|uniref:type IV pilin-like G/H family protein n=1 Tax=Nostoc sp. LEGE 06077 TaxID=915325 RepID=UPI00187FCEBE|nr:type IV pilin-like G/H family protein [Nostoc sp. LEGE 06077]MBE9208210.1 type IV pilin-like G/H family protein [Nostoc sp. LEGE 06077]
MYRNFEQRLILGLCFLGLIGGSAILLGIAILLCFIFNDMFFGCSMSCKAFQALGTTTASRFNLAQRSYYLNHEKFSTSLSKLQTNIEPKMGKYNFFIKTINSPKKHEITYFYAVSRVAGLKSYVSAVAVIPDVNSKINDILTITIKCETNSPSQNQPNDPQVKNTDLSCGKEQFEIKH